MRLLLSGYYGFGNLGDEALLEITTQELRRRHPSLVIDVLSQTPAETARRYGIEATARADISAVRAAIARADLVLSGGGGLLQNATSSRSLLYYGGIVRAAIRAGKPTAVFAQSIGPLDRLGRFIVRKTCTGLTRATVRDAASRALLYELVPKVPVELAADPVWMMEQTAAGDLEAEGLGAGSDPLAVVSIRKIPAFERGVRAMAAAVDRLAERGFHVAFLPLGGASDAEASTTIIRACSSAPVLLPAFPLEKAARVIARAQVLIGMRLHALIIAARLGVPFLSIPYDPKVSALCEELAWPLAPLWEPLKRGSGSDTIAVGALVDRLCDEREVLRSHLSAQLPRMRALAQRNFEVVDELLV
ncbi:MAG: polysaccharide pyruvyl transferase CsaB [Vulcanimicrobiaceae bacterium]